MERPAAPTIADVGRALAGRAPRLAPDSVPRAGVAVILHEVDALASVLVIRRAEHPDDPWSGHMAMPGGRTEPGDATVRDTAEREALEEVGIDLRRKGRFLGPLDELFAITHGSRLGLVLSPFVYAIEGGVELARAMPNEEVREALYVPLRDLLDPAVRCSVPYTYAGTRLLLPAWRWQERVIWGLTYRMLGSLLSLAGRGS